ncbi:oligosaccharide flippase family protein [Aureimonas fodinaquatilis]|uniref:Oligosaccharide flippase family protein n=1 Tax=Aureimonas fodinaquatilis TaxID=2565783 RepID=A0A5B0DXU8_9HYPH|nr:oligosaccharide flippase family protein [Aureimonas fodinaquatilis]KAA0970571.1 oligosaccharide flippase family protein [Aureimonas fodinaquatilis]
MTADSVAQPLRRRISSAGLWSMGQFGASLSVRLLSNMILTRMLLPEAFGMVAVVSVLTIALALLSDLGIGQNVIVHNRGNEPAFLNTAWTVQVLRGLFIWSLAIMAAGLITLLAARGVFSPGTVYVDPRLPAVLIVGSFIVVLQGLESTKVHQARRNLQIRRLTEIEFGVQILALAMTVLLAWYWQSIWALVLGSVFSSTIKTIATHLLLSGQPNRLGWEQQAWWEIFRFGRWIFFSSIVGVLFTTGDRLILGGLVDVNTMGLYAIAALLLSVVQSAVTTLVGTVAFPALSELARGDRQGFRQAYLRFQAAADGILGLAAGGIYICGPLVVSVLYDPRYAESGAMLSILAVGLIGMRYCIVEQCYMACDEMRYFLASNVLRLLVMVVLLPLGHAYYGLEGALTAIVLAQFAAWPVAWLFKAKHRLFDWRTEGAFIPAVALGLLLGNLLLMLVNAF